MFHPDYFYTLTMQRVEELRAEAEELRTAEEANPHHHWTVGEMFAHLLDWLHVITGPPSRMGGHHV